MVSVELRAIGVASTDDLSYTLTAEYSYRFLSQCLAPLAVLCVAHLASAAGWHHPNNPMHYVLCHMVIRSPIFMLIGRLGCPS